VSFRLAAPSSFVLDVVFDGEAGSSRQPSGGDLGSENRGIGVGATQVQSTAVAAAPHKAAAAGSTHDRVQPLGP